MFGKQVLRFLIVVLLLFPAIARSAWVDSQQHNGVMYFLFSAPNKLVRYDLINETFLDEIKFDNVPTAFTISNDIAFVAFHEKLDAINLTSNVSETVYTLPLDLRSVSTMGDLLFLVDANFNILVLNKTSHEPVELAEKYVNKTPFIFSP